MNHHVGIRWGPDLALEEALLGNGNTWVYPDLPTVEIRSQPYSQSGSSDVASGYDFS